MEKPKIVQIVVTERKGGNTNVPVILGLSGEGDVYEWGYPNREWQPYWQLDQTNT